MFSMDSFDFEAVMSRHLFEGSSGGNTSSDYFLCDDNTTDSGDSYCGFNSDQENNENKE